MLDVPHEHDARLGRLEYLADLRTVPGRAYRPVVYLRVRGSP